jgi:hypothetical protein
MESWNQSPNDNKKHGLLQCWSYYVVQVIAGQFSYLENSPCEWSFQKRQFFPGHPDEEIETLILAITGNEMVWFIKLGKKTCRANFRSKAEGNTEKSQRNSLWKICAISYY